MGEPTLPQDDELLRLLVRGSGQVITVASLTIYGLISIGLGSTPLAEQVQFLWPIGLCASLGVLTEVMGRNGSARKAMLPLLGSICALVVFFIGMAF